MVYPVTDLESGVTLSNNSAPMQHYVPLQTMADMKSQYWQQSSQLQPSSRGFEGPSQQLPSTMPLVQLESRMEQLVTGCMESLHQSLPDQHAPTGGVGYAQMAEAYPPAIVPPACNMTGQYHAQSGVSATGPYNANIDHLFVDDSKRLRCIQPSGPRQQGQGVENEEQGIVELEKVETESSKSSSYWCELQATLPLQAQQPLPALHSAVPASVQPVASAQLGLFNWQHFNIAAVTHLTLSALAHHRDNKCTAMHARNICGVTFALEVSAAYFHARQATALVCLSTSCSPSSRKYYINDYLDAFPAAW
eukprot:CAMPEP_0117663808 /NCGR_PEP_ID=MMETSP0804-20121206/8824_1 /TAXON_ID=1074897 /ORGANISM="Tetraselmis astigmatica, Strain CCMP880" /LENGTH=306 /DNA_ID=CAMNT_0005470879 /DNA_START=375 /DNA_END=1292 /DNA_ORIENTATION=-